MQWQMEGGISLGVHLLRNRKVGPPHHPLDMVTEADFYSEPGTAPLRCPNNDPTEEALLLPHLTDGESKASGSEIPFS